MTFLLCLGANRKAQKGGGGRREGPPSKLHVDWTVSLLAQLQGEGWRLPGAEPPPTEGVRAGAGLHLCRHRQNDSCAVTAKDRTSLSFLRL